MEKTELKLKAIETIDKVYDRIEKLNKRRDTLNASLKETYDEQIEKLSKRRAELKEKLNELENASEERWKEAKEAFSVSLEHYKAGFEELKRIFK